MHETPIRPEAMRLAFALGIAEAQQATPRTLAERLAQVGVRRSPLADPRLDALRAFAAALAAGHPCEAALRDALAAGWTAADLEAAARAIPAAAMAA